MKEKSVLEMRNIHKNFPGVKALQGVDFNLCEGEIHALMGENGAGKSTLIKVLTGVYEKDEGQIWLKGIDKAVAIRSPQDAQRLGISTVYQEITLCPNLSVAENMYIGRTKGLGQNWKKMNADADKILQSLDIPARADQQLSSCSIAIQQMVAIARAVDMDCKVLILDEPTSSLDEQEVAKLFGLMRDLKARGVGIIFVTHFLDQVYEVCDKITVLRDGKLVGEYEIKELPACSWCLRCWARSWMICLISAVRARSIMRRMRIKLCWRSRTCRAMRGSSLLTFISEKER